MLFIKKKEVDPRIKEINYMIDYMIYDGTTACLGSEGRLVRNGELHVIREEYHSVRSIDTGTIIRDYIDYILGNSRGYENVFGMGGEYGESVTHEIRYCENGKYKTVYSVEINIEPDNTYLSSVSKMDEKSIDFNAKWFSILREEYYKEKEQRNKVLQKKL